MAPIAAGVERVIVDLTETTFIDSSSLGVADRRAPAAQGARRAAHRRVRRRGDREDVPDHRARRRLQARRLGRGRARRAAPKQRSLRRVDGGTGFPSAGRAGRLLARPPRAAARGARPAAAARARRRRADPAVRRGRRRARHASARSQLGLRDDPARLGRRHGRPHARLRPRLPPHHAARARPLAADRRRAAARRVVPADLRLPDRRPALRPRRPPPRLGRQVARPRATSTPTSPRCARGSATGERRCGSPTCRSRSHERLFRERVPLDADAARPGAAVGPVGLRPAGRGRRGLGLPRHAGAARVHGPRGGRAALVRGGLPARRRDAARGRLHPLRRDARRDAYMRVVTRALRAAAHARVERRDPRPPPGRASGARRAPHRGAAAKR